MADGPKIAEAHIDIVADMSNVRADLAKVKDMLKDVQAPAAKTTSAFTKLTAVFTGITAGLGLLRVGFGALKSVVGGVAKIIGGALKVAFTVVRKVAETVFAVMRSGFNMAVAGVKKFVSFTKQAIQTQAEFGQSMARVGALTNTVGTRDFDSLRKKALDLGKATEFSAGEAADAMGNFAMAGFKTNQIMEAVGPTLDFASANQLSLAQSSDIAARVMGAMGIEASRTNDVMDALTIGATKTNQNVVDLGEAFKNAGSSSKAAGVDLEGTTAALMVLADQGQRGSEAGSALKQVFLKMPSKNVQKLFGNMGIAMTDAAGAMRPMPDLIDELNRSMVGKGEFEKLNLLTEAFGTRAGPAMIKLLMAGGDAWRDYTKVVRGATGETQRIADIQRATVATSFKIVKSAADDLRIAIGDVFEPFVIESNKNFVGIFNMMAAKVREWTPFVQDKIAKFMDWMKANFFNAFEVGAATVFLFFDDIVRAYDAFMSTMKSAVGGSGSFMSEFLGLDQVPQDAGIVQKAFFAITTGFLKLSNGLELFLSNMKFGFEDFMDGLVTGAKIAALKIADAFAIGDPGAEERKILQEARNQNRRSFEIMRGAAERRIRSSGEERLAAAQSKINDDLFGGTRVRTKGAGTIAAERAKELTDGFRNAFKSGDPMPVEEKKPNQQAKAIAEASAAVAARPGPAGPISPVGIAGTIATVFGQMKVGVTEEVKLLGELVKLNKVIASNTGSQGTLGGILS